MKLAIVTFTLVYLQNLSFYEPAYSLSESLTEENHLVGVWYFICYYNELWGHNLDGIEVEYPHQTHLYMLFLILCLFKCVSYLGQQIHSFLLKVQLIKGFPWNLGIRKVQFLKYIFVVEWTATTFLVWKLIILNLS